jgi:GNAT superfamily N-acetyltransferase
VTDIRPLAASDREDWLRLWRGYLEFYESSLPDDVTDDVFARLVADVELHGAIARDDDGRAVGIVHWLFHPSTWTRSTYCYLEDLFVAPDARTSGVGRMLIARVREAAETARAAKVYWLTQQGNARARRLYDAVAADTGFVHYEIELDRD